MAQLFVETLFQYRDKKNYLLHEFVLMPDHFHLLISPIQPRTIPATDQGRIFLPRKKRIRIRRRIWEKSFYDRRVRGVEDHYTFKQYIRQNPLRQKLAAAFADYPHSSARQEFTMDDVPQRLKPSSLSA